MTAFLFKLQLCSRPSMPLVHQSIGYIPCLCHFVKCLLSWKHQNDSGLSDGCVYKSTGGKERNETATRVENSQEIDCLLLQERHGSPFLVQKCTPVVWQANQREGRTVWQKCLITKPAAQAASLRGAQRPHAEQKVLTVARGATPTAAVLSCTDNPPS